MSSEDDITKAVVSAVRTVKDDADYQIGVDEMFDNHSLDSLDRMSMLVEVEQSLGLDLDGVDPKGLTCIKDYVSAIQSRSDAT